MSRNNPVPRRDLEQFITAMAAAEVESAAREDIYWRLLEAAEEFMLDRRYQYGDPLAALRQYQRLRADRQAHAEKFPGVDIDAVHRTQQAAALKRRDTSEDK